MTSRLSICYAAPGHTLLSSAGSTRNILAAADAMSEWADVTVAFRNIAEPVQSERFSVIAMEEGATEGSVAKDDVAARGLNPLAHWQFLRSLREFATASRDKYDVVFEKGWRLSGYLANRFTELGVPSALIENDARWWNEPLRSPRALVKYAAHTAAQSVAGRCSRALPLVIAETEELKKALVVQRRVEPSNVRVVALGVDHSLFKPLPQRAARAELGISADAFVMLYVGGMDQYHDLSPLLIALGSHVPVGLEVHLVGDGDYRGRYEKLANESAAPVVFHGQVEHSSVPHFVSAADVCLAPYQVRGFYENQVSFSTLKIPEYMACGRPVISVPSGNILSLIEHGSTGLLFPNEPEAWSDQLQQLPTRGAFAEMQPAAIEKAAQYNWSGTARQYLDLAERVLST